MGFSHQHALEALLHSNNNFDAATEYLLATPAPVVSTSAALSAGETINTATANTAATSTTASSSNDAEVNLFFLNIFL